MNENVQANLFSSGYFPPPNMQAITRYNGSESVFIIVVIRRVNFPQLSFSLITAETVSLIKQTAYQLVAILLADSLRAACQITAPVSHTQGRVGHAMDYRERALEGEGRERAGRGPLRERAGRRPLRERAGRRRGQGEGP